MTLPLYVALEKVDFRLLEAAQDLYAGPWRPRGTIVGGIGGAIARASSSALVIGLRPADARPSAGADRSARSSGRSSISEAFIRVTLPLPLPGVFAGSLLTFIPAVGDYINAELLGNPSRR